MSRIKDLTGMRFCRLIAMQPVGRIRRSVAWECHCDCGGTTTVPTPQLLNGNTRSCGCLQVETRVGGRKNTTHGLTNSSVYRIYKGMIHRCQNPNSPGYRRYGGRGIHVCPRWLESFENFFADMGHRPPGKTLDRINNDGNYEPSNCRWADQLTQQNNRSSNRLYEFGGRSLTLAQWSREVGIPVSTVRNRLDRGWQFGRAITEPQQSARGLPLKAQPSSPSRKSVLEFQGERLTISQWAERTGCNPETLCYRVKAGWAIDVALAAPTISQRMSP